MLQKRNGNHDAEGSLLQLGGNSERRLKQRFQIERDARYKLLFGYRIAESGAAKTVNISSSGVWIRTATALPEGVPVELAISWPVLLNDNCPMKLMVFGCVMRSTDSGAAISIERYEFRTLGTSVFQPLVPTADEMRLQP
ncbi:MAG: hypothetical protein M1541_16495 [Acidobacteria bacterium]|nr:hypothetical protein [Acidobacteriota bacterium]